MPRKKKKVKYKGVCRNKSEAEIYRQLKKKRGWKVNYESEKLPYVLVRNYIPDWTLKGPDGRVVRVEYKGHFDAASRSKMAAVRKVNPEMDIRFIFSDATKKVYKGRPMTYGDWADKYGFVWADKSVPEDWFK